MESTGTRFLNINDLKSFNLKIEHQDSSSINGRQTEMS